MKSPGRAIGSRVASAVERWRCFWFESQPAYSLGLIRIAFGALVFLWGIELGQDLYERFGSSSFVPPDGFSVILWTIFDVYPSDTAVLLGWACLMVSSLALMLGWHSKVAAILVFILVMSFERRNPMVFNGGDALIRIQALCMVLAPCGAALSLDQRRRTGSFFTAQNRQLWVIRFLQFQLSVIYLSTVLAKLRGDTWQDGTAVSYALRLSDMQLLPVPRWLTETPIPAQALTWGALLTELAIGLLVWNKRWRLRVLLAGVVLHTTIMLTLTIGFFSLAMFVLYLAFVPPERAQALAEWVKTRADEASARLKRLMHRGEQQDEAPAGDESRLADRPEIARARGSDVDDEAGSPARVAPVARTSRPRAAHRRRNGRADSCDRVDEDDSVARTS